MKTEKEIKAMIKTCKDLKAVIPQHNFFGRDNWDVLDKSILVLGRCIGKSEDELNAAVNTILDTMDGDESCESPVVKAYDWVLGNTDDEPASKEDVHIFKTQKKEEEKRK